MENLRKTTHMKTCDRKPHSTLENRMKRAKDPNQGFDLQNDSFLKVYESQRNRPNGPSGNTKKHDVPAGMLVIFDYSKILGFKGL